MTPSRPTRAALLVWYRDSLADMEKAMPVVRAAMRLVGKKGWIYDAQGVITDKAAAVRLEEACARLTKHREKKKKKINAKPALHYVPKGK